MSDPRTFRADSTAEESTVPPAVVHVDLDGASAIHAAHGWPFPHKEDPLFETGLRNTLAFLDEAGVKATLFAIARDLDDPRKRALLEAAVEQGHEIGCHSYTHRKLTHLSHEEQQKEVVESRERISTTLDVPVDGFRAPYFDIDAGILDLIEKAGYAYDSSYFPGKRVRLSGQEVATKAEPFYWPGGGLAELPLPGHRPLPFPIHASYSLVLGNWYFHQGLRRFRKTGAPLVWLLHLTDLADPLPTGMLGSRRAKFYTISYLDTRRKRSRCSDMLDSISRHYNLVNSRHLMDSLDGVER